MKNTISFENFIDLYNSIVSTRELITLENDTNKAWVQKLKDTEISAWEYQHVKDITNNPDIDYPLKFTIPDSDNNPQNYYNNNPNADIIIHIYLDDKAEWTPDNKSIDTHIIQFIYNKPFSGIKPINIQFRDNTPFSDITPINVIIIPKNVFTLNISSGDNTIETLYNLKEYYTDFFTDMILTDSCEKLTSVKIMAETLANIFLHDNIVDYDIDKIYEYKIKELEKEETEEFRNYKESILSQISSPYTNDMQDASLNYNVPYFNLIFHNIISIEEFEKCIKPEYLNSITDFVTFVNNIVDNIQKKYYSIGDIEKLRYLYLDYLDEYKYKYFNTCNKVMKLIESKKAEVETIKVDGDKDVPVSV